MMRFPVWDDRQQDIRWSMVSSFSPWLGRRPPSPSDHSTHRGFCSGTAGDNPQRSRTAWLLRSRWWWVRTRSLTEPEGRTKFRLSQHELKRAEQTRSGCFVCTRMFRWSFRLLHMFWRRRPCLEAIKVSCRFIYCLRTFNIECAM